MIRRTVLRSAFFAGVVFLCAQLTSAQSDAEIRVLNYIREHLRTGEPLLVTELYNKVFTQPEERRALDKLYNSFFRLPLFVAQYEEKMGVPPSLKIIAEQFDLHSPEAADVLLRAMESDPRVPRFFTRDPKTGEITGADVQKVRTDQRFGEVLERQLGGWEGKPAPSFNLPRLNRGSVDSASLRGKMVLLYVWFTGCLPCMEETPALVKLRRELLDRDLAIVGANADQILGLDYDDNVRRRYAKEQAINFPLVRWTREDDKAFRTISIFPTLFLIDRNGTILHQWIGFVSPEELRGTITKALGRRSHAIVTMVCRTRQQKAGNIP